MRTASFTCACPSSIDVNGITPNAHQQPAAWRRREVTLRIPAETYRELIEIAKAERTSLRALMIEAAQLAIDLRQTRKDA